MKRIVDKYKSGNRVNSKERSDRNSFRQDITEVREVSAIEEDTMKSGQSISIKDALKQ